MGRAQVTLLVEDLDALAAALPGGRRYPALEALLCRGRPQRVLHADPNRLRFSLFGRDIPVQLPVAALSQAAEGNAPEPGTYWLRADPVTLRADMTRVFMVDSGLAEAGGDVREALGRIVREELAAEGFGTAEEHGSFWCLRLDEPLPFAFRTLGEALGMDQAEALPDHPEARYWKRLLTGLQVALHQDNDLRAAREQGQPVPNSIWFWGGGVMPGSSVPAFDAVFSNDPVSRGLARAQGLEPDGRDAYAPGAGRTLVDWSMASRDAAAEAGALERMAGRLLAEVRTGAVELMLYSGRGDGWRCDRSSLRRVWHRRRPLSSVVVSGDKS